MITLSLIKDIESHLRDLSPHIKQRQTATLLKQALTELRLLHRVVMICEDCTSNVKISRFIQEYKDAKASQE